MLFALTGLATALPASAQTNDPIVTTPEGQAGIGTLAPHSSAILDLVSTYLGLLVPRMTTDQRNQIENPATGLLIFNTTTGRFEFNDGTPESPNWLRLNGIEDSGNEGDLLVSGGPDDPPTWHNPKEVIGESVWLLDGNSGTDDAENFIGTTDEEDLAFRTNNSERARIDTDGNLGLGTSSPNVRADIDGGLAIRPPSVVTATTSTPTTITVGNRSYIRVDSDSSIFDRPVILTDGLQDGQILVIQCIAPCSESFPPYGVEITGGNILTGFSEGPPGAFLWTNDNITFIWDGDQEVWVEISRTEIGCFEEDNPGRINPDNEGEGNHRLTPRLQNLQQRYHQNEPGLLQSN